MKRFILIGATLVTLIIVSSAVTPATAGVRFGLFYNSLAPYGEWVNCSYGEVWRPLNVEYGWRPYLYGRWAWTDDGWYWVSDEPFGWATFHYGRWVYDDFYGWVWVPDDVWGPAWVEWRYSDDYIGWAPLSPAARFSVSFGLRFDAGWSTPVHYWNFVPCRNFTSVRVVDYVQPVERSRRFFGSTRGVRTIDVNGDRIINRGIDVNFVERRTQSRIERTEIVNRSSGEGDRMTRADGHQRLEVYRPRIEATVRTQGETRSGTERGNVNIQIQRNTEVQRNNYGTRTVTPNRHYEVQRNNEQRREVFQQQMQNRRATQQAEMQNRRQQMQERREAPQRQTRTDQQPRQQRQPEVQRERRPDTQQQGEPRRGRRP